MSGERPAVSVVMAVCNPDPVYLREAVDSVLRQTFSDFELLIVEDPSPASAKEILDDIRDPRLVLCRNATPLGLAESLNAGIARSRAPLIARLDADDVCVPERLEKQVAFLRAHPEIDVYGSRITVIDAAGRPFARRLLPLQHDDIAAALRRYNCISHPSVMMRKEPVERAGGYVPMPAEDYDLWSRMLLAGSRFENSAEDLVLYRLHPGASKFTVIRAAIRACIEIKVRHLSGRFTARDRLRLLAERTLLLLPQPIVLWLFTRLQYKR